jgi:hypothetical protein
MNLDRKDQMRIILQGMVEEHAIVFKKWLDVRTLKI